MKKIGIGLLIIALSALTAIRAQEPGSGEGPDHARKRDEWFAQSRRVHGKIPPGLRLKALADLKAMRAREKQTFLQRFGNTAFAQGSSVTLASPSDYSLAATTAQWTSIGPHPMVFASNAFSGRVAALAIDPLDTNILYAGTADGGVWKTTDGGAHWQPLTDTQNSLTIGSIKLDPTNPDIIYVGTGEADDGLESYYGAGLLKSSDGGTTWQNIQAPFVTNGNSVRIGSIDIDPSDSNVLLAATTGGTGKGIYRSTDAGATWTPVYTGGSTFTVRFLPNSPNVALAVSYDETSVNDTSILRSTDAGNTWQIVLHASADLSFGAYDGALAVVSGANTIYAALGGNQAALLYKSTDAGATWTALSTKTTSGQVMCAAQCWYNLVLAVNPANPNLVYFGTSNLFSSSDGGSNWQAISILHPDFHALTFTPAGDRLYTGNDGGVWSTTDLGAVNPTWNDLNQDLATLQFYPGISIFPGNPNFGLGGTQDNGMLRYNGNPAWTEILSIGDSSYTAIDPTTTSRLYGTTQNGYVWQSLDGGSHFSLQNNGLPVPGSNFLTPLTMDPQNSSRLYTAPASVIYRSDDGTSSWTQVSSDLGSGVGNITVAPSDSNTVYVATRTAVWVSRNALSASPSWTSYAGVGRQVMKIAVDPHDPSVAYAALGGYGCCSGGHGNVYKLTNYGATWTDITSNLVDAPVNDVVVDPDVANTLYIANDVGVFSTSDGGQSWNSMVTGLPRVIVMGLALDRATRTLRAATYGRSMFDLVLPGVTIPCAAPSSNGINVCSPADGSTVTSPVHVLASATVSGSVYRFELWANGTKVASVANSGTLDQNVTLANGAYQLTFVARNSANTSRYTKTINITVGATSGCAPPSSNGIVVCSPADSSTVQSPVAAKAYAKVSGTIYRFELWANGTKVASVANSGTMDQNVTLANGSYQLTFVARNTDNSSRYTKTISITVGSGASCAPPSSNGIVVCSPAEGSSVTSPVAVQAYAKVSGSMYRFELWENSTKLASVANSGTMSVSIARPAGSYQWVFVARNIDNSSRYTKTVTFTVH